MSKHSTFPAGFLVRPKEGVYGANPGFFTWQRHPLRADGNRGLVEVSVIFGRLLPTLQRVQRHTDNVCHDASTKPSNVTIRNPAKVLIERSLVTNNDA